MPSTPISSHVKKNSPTIPLLFMFGGLNERFYTINDLLGVAPQKYAPSSPINQKHKKSGKRHLHHDNQPPTSYINGNISC